jgi:hypothetical protein
MPSAVTRRVYAERNAFSVLFLQPFEIKKWLLILQSTIKVSQRDRDMTQADYQNCTSLPGPAVPGALLANGDAVSFPPPASPRAKPSRIASDMSGEFAPQKSEAEFEKLLQEFCQLARLGYTILNQSKSQLIEVADLLGSLGDGDAAEDLHKLVVRGREKAEALLELTNAAKLRYEFAFLRTASEAAA